MTATSANANEEDAIRAVIDAWARAMRAKDADEVVSQYAANNVKFILAPPLQYTKEHPFDKKSLQQWFSSFQGPIEYENRDLNITTGTNVGFCHSLNRMMATTTKGDKMRSLVPRDPRLSQDRRSMEDHARA